MKFNRFVATANPVVELNYYFLFFIKKRKTVWIMISWLHYKYDLVVDGKHGSTFLLQRRFRWYLPMNPSPRYPQNLLSAKINQPIKTPKRIFKKSLPVNQIYRSNLSASNIHRLLISISPDKQNF